MAEQTEAEGGSMARAVFLVLLGFVVGYVVGSGGSGEPEVAGRPIEIEDREEVEE